MIYLYVMNVIRRFCMFFCALGFFLNFNLGNFVFGAVVNLSKSHSESEQIALRKVAGEVNFNAFEFEEYIELGENEGDFDIDMDMLPSTIEGPLSKSNILLSQNIPISHIATDGENFLFSFRFRISGNSARHLLTFKSIVLRIL